MNSDKKMFQRAKDVLVGLEMAERQHEKDLSRKCDWEDPQDVSCYKSQKRIKERTELLDRLVPTRVCPGCKEKPFNFRSWMVSKDETKAICRSCFQRDIAKQPGGGEVQEPIFGEVVERFSIDSDRLTHARHATELTLSQFARKAGWHATYQSRLESGDVKTVTAEVAEVCAIVVKENGAEDVLPLFDEDDKNRSFTVNGRVIEQARLLAGLTRNEFSRQMGWTGPYQAKLECGDVKTLQEQPAVKIIEILHRNSVTTLDEIN